MQNGITKYCFSVRCRRLLFVESAPRSTSGVLTIVCLHFASTRMLLTRPKTYDKVAPALFMMTGFPLGRLSVDG